MQPIDPIAIERAIHALDRTIRDLMAHRDALAGQLPGRKVVAVEFDGKMWLKKAKDGRR